MQVGQNNRGPVVRMERVPAEETQRRARVELRQLLWETPIPLDEIEPFVSSVVAEIRSDEP